MKIWEYKVVMMPVEQIADMLNRQGSEGWEAFCSFTALDYSSGIPSPRQYVLFKRPSEGE
jgi:hypothetical protein